MGGASSSDQPPPPPPPPPGASAGASAGGHKVSLNVYSPTGAQHAIYHTGVEVFGAEYVFGGGDTSFSGVTAQRPRVPPPGSGWLFYQTVELGSSRSSKSEIERAIAELRSEFPASSYDLLTRNCNHFSDALTRRLCGQGIPSWVNRMAGVGAAVRGAVGGGGAAAGGGAASTGKAEAGAGGLAAAGVVARSVGADGDLNGEVDWASAGLLNAKEADPTEALRAQGVVSSEDDTTGELLLLLPMTSPVKLQSIRVQAPDPAKAPSRARLFANQRNLDVDDAAGGVAATQEFDPLVWSPSLDGSGVVATLEVNFLKFQNLGFLAVYFGRSESDEQDPEIPIVVQGFKLSGRN